MYRIIEISLSLSKEQVHRFDAWFLTDPFVEIPGGKYARLSPKAWYVAFASSVEYDYHRTKAYVDVDIIFEVSALCVSEKNKVVCAIKRELQRILLFPEK